MIRGFNKLSLFFSKLRQSRFFRRRNIVILIFICVVLVIASVFYFNNNTNIDDSGDQPISAEEAKIKKKEKSVEQFNEADNLNSNGDYKGAQSNLDENLKKQTTNEDKAQVYESKTLIALNAGQFDEAMNFAQKAEDLYPSTSTAVRLYTVATVMKDKDLSIKYCKLVVERMSEGKSNQNSNMYDQYYKYYQSKLEELQSGE